MIHHLTADQLRNKGETRHLQACLQISRRKFRPGGHPFLIPGSNTFFSQKIKEQPADMGLAHIGVRAG